MYWYTQILHGGSSSTCMTVKVNTKWSIIEYYICLASPCCVVVVMTHPARVRKSLVFDSGE